MCSESSKMEWSHETCLQLVDAYEKFPLLWNPKNGLYYNKTKKNYAWDTIDNMIGCPPGEAKKKMDSMLSSFRREKNRNKKKIVNGREKVYSSKWFAFKRLAFLLDRDEPRKTAFSEEDDVSTSAKLLDENEDEASQTEEVYLEEQHTLTTAPEKRPEKKRKKREADEQISQALDILEKVSQSEKSDSCAIYGQHVAHKLRSYSTRTINIVQHHINLILFNADMGQYNNGLSSTYLHPASASSSLSTFVGPISSQPNSQTQSLPPSDEEYDSKPILNL